MNNEVFLEQVILWAVMNVMVGPACFVINADSYVCHKFLHLFLYDRKLSKFVRIHGLDMLGIENIYKKKSNKKWMITV